MFGAIKLEFAWILAREKHLDPEMVRMIPMIHNYEEIEDDSNDKMTIPSWSTQQMS